MKSKQLANVLIKVLGISICVSGFPTFLFSIFDWLMISVMSFATSTDLMSTPTDHTLMRRVYVGAMSYGLQLILGLIFIFKSRKIAEYFFKDEDE